MRRTLLALLFLVSPLLAQEDDPPFPPVAYPADRYALMMKRSPFVLPTPDTVAVAPPPAPNWTTDYRIMSVLRSGDDYMLLIRQVSTDERVSVRKARNAQGIRLVEVQMSADPRSVSATLERGGEEGTVQYDDSILSNVPQSVVPANPALKPE